MSGESLTVDPSVLVELAGTAARRSSNVRGLARQEPLAPLADGVPSSAMSVSAASAATMVSSALQALADRVDQLAVDTLTSADAYAAADDDTSAAITSVPPP